MQRSITPWATNCKPERDLWAGTDSSMLVKGARCPNGEATFGAEALFYRAAGLSSPNAPLFGSGLPAPYSIIAPQCAIARVSAAYLRWGSTASGGSVQYPYPLAWFKGRWDDKNI